MLDRDELREKEGSVELDIDFSKFFKFLVVFTVLVVFFVVPSVGFYMVYFSVGYYVSVWVLPEGRDSSFVKKFLLSLFWVLGVLPVFLLKNYYDFMNVEDDD